MGHIPFPKSVTNEENGVCTVALHYMKYTTLLSLQKDQFLRANGCKWLRNGACIIEKKKKLIWVSKMQSSPMSNKLATPSPTSSQTFHWLCYPSWIHHLDTFFFFSLKSNFCWLSMKLPQVSWKINTTVIMIFRSCSLPGAGDISVLKGGSGRYTHLQDL